MFTFGRFLGWIIVTGYFLTVMNYFIKRINRRFIMKMPNDAKVRRRFNVLMRFIVKNHRIIAILTTFVLIYHFVVQYLSWGFYWTGIIAGSLLMVQGFLGSFGTYIKKKKPGIWLFLHRTNAILLTAAIIFHILTVALRLRII